jgi:hypothetical protein
MKRSPRVDDERLLKAAGGGFFSQENIFTGPSTILAAVKLE